MADKFKYLDDTGVIVPDVDEVKGEVQQEWRDAIGQDLILRDDTPQGQLIDGETLARSNVIRSCAQLANQINPNLAGGVWLDATCSWLGIYREPATHTLIPGCILEGQPQTLIPQGSRARTKNGDIAESLAAVRLNASGTATCDFQIVETGPVAVPADYLYTIVDTVLGWQSIRNPTAGTLGRDQQSDASLRAVRALRLANNAISTREAIISNLYGVSGLQSLQFRENVGDTTTVIDGITMVPHSIWVCVNGGASNDVAEVLLREKTDGAGWNGKITVQVVDSSSGQPYDVQFDRATAVPLQMVITATEGDTSIDLESTIKNAVLAYAAGEVSGERGFVTGVDISPFEVSGAINIQNPSVFVRQVQLGRKGGALQSTVLEMKPNEVATISAENITVVRA